MFQEKAPLQGLLIVDSSYLIKLLHYWETVFIPFKSTEEMARKGYDASSIMISEISNTPTKPLQM